MTVGDRIKKARKALDLTQQAFADRLGMKQNTIATYEMNRTNPSDPAIKSICREFNINESWLRTGEGEMFLPKPVDILDELVQKLGLSEGDRIFIQKFLDLNPAERQAVLKYVSSVAAEYSGRAAQSAPAFAPATIAGPDLTLEQEADEFAAMAREQFLLEKEQASQASSVKESGSA